MPEIKPVEHVSDNDEFDDEIEGGEWVTIDNLHKHISGGGNTKNLMENQDFLLFQRPEE